jgi:hypothetical protein
MFVALFYVLFCFVLDHKFCCGTALHFRYLGGSFKWVGRDAELKDFGILNGGNLMDLS